MNRNRSSSTRSIWLPVALAALAVMPVSMAAPPAPGVLLTVETPAKALDGLSFEWKSASDTFPGSFSVTRVQDLESMSLIGAYYNSPEVGEVTIASGNLTVQLSDATLVGYNVSGGQDSKGNNVETFTFEPNGQIIWNYTSQ